jgi:energy-coupling factor transporter ATP-binding protein EcfA2
MSFDYSLITSTEAGLGKTWRDIYDENIPLPTNLLFILQQAVFLPHDFYDVIGSYFLLPSALCNVVPYLFLHGQSGSGKSTLAKVAKYLHGVSFNSSSDTFAGIRNSLDSRRNTWVESTALNSDGEPYSFRKQVEKNTCMVWDDVDGSVFVNSPDLYRLFKFGYDRTTDKITLSSKETGINLEFRCFCPKILSTISPLHLDDRFRELKRRLIVIPCTRVEELSPERMIEQGITLDDWQSKLLKIDSYNWDGFSNEFQKFWDLDRAKLFIETRQKLIESKTGLNSQQFAISTDLITTGIASGVWESQEYAMSRMHTYWDWFKSETEAGTSLGQLLRKFLGNEVKNCKASGRVPEIYSNAIHSQVKAWLEMGWLLEAPRGREVANLLYDQGWRFKEGKWSKG